MGLGDGRPGRPRPKIPAYPVVGELLVAARHELDEKTRFDMWRQLQEIIHEDAPYIPLFAPEWVLATQPDIENAVPGPLRIYAQEIRRKTDS
jgi:ABC-type transport system substrate-binding protein